MWKAGIATRIITPDGSQWLSGYGSKRPAAGTRHDLWVKALALEDAAGNRAVLVTSDLVGLSGAMCEALAAACWKRFRLSRAQLLLTYSHNHCAPVTTDVLPDYYPLEPDDWLVVDAYTRQLEARVLETIAEALARLAPAVLSAGEGTAHFAVNRRNNREAEVPALREQGTPLRGPVDHSVPVLVVRSREGALRAVVFGYACHPTTLSDLHWCGDYPGYAQLAVEQAHPGVTALFWTGCGGDQNPLPRRSVTLCEQYGRELAEGAAQALAGEMRPLTPELRTAFETVTLAFDRHPSREELEKDAASPNGVRARWASRMLPLLQSGHRFADGCPYGVQALRLGDQLWLALGGEAVVDYALRFKQEYGARTWITGYAHEMVGYVPSRRVWREGGYEAEFVYEYGWPAYRWTEDTEDRIAAAVNRLVAAVRPADLRPAPP